MPNIKSAKKRVKVIKTKTLQNKMTKSALKTALKAADAAVAANADNKAEVVKVAIKKWIRLLQKAFTTKTLLHVKNPS